MNPKKQKPRSPQTGGGNSALRQQRMDAYLRATQAEFEAAVARSQALGQAAQGVLVGPLVRA